MSACFECTLDLFPPQQAVPLCTIAETPRNAAHCILYAHLIEAPKHFPDEKPDKDDPVYQKWASLTPSWPICHPPPKKSIPI